MKGYRKLTASLVGTGASLIAVGNGWIDGAQFVTCMTICVGGFLAANYAASKKA